MTVPAAGPHASTEDRTNKFRVPEVQMLLESLLRNGITFKNSDEVEACLIPQMDKLH